jgi:hypothetical protein
VNDCINGTFLNPSQTENHPPEKMFKCVKCNYKAGRKIELMDHKKENIIGVTFISQASKELERTYH